MSSVFMKTMAAKNPISALRKEQEQQGPIRDKLKMIMSSLTCPGGNCKPKGSGKKRYKHNKQRYNKKA